MKNSGISEESTVRTGETGGKFWGHETFKAGCK